VVVAGPAGPRCCIGISAHTRTRSCAAQAHAAAGTRAVARGTTPRAGFLTNHAAPSGAAKLQAARPTAANLGDRPTRFAGCAAAVLIRCKRTGPADLMNDRSDAFLSTDQTQFIAGRRPRAHISQDAQGAQRVDPAVWGIAPPQDRSRPAGPVWAHVPHRVGWLLMPLPRRRMGLSSDEERALSEGAKAGAFFLGRIDRPATTSGSL
jgi:hypothetical protein